MEFWQRFLCLALSPYGPWLWTHLTFNKPKAKQQPTRLKTFSLLLCRTLSLALLTPTLSASLGKSHKKCVLLKDHYFIRHELLAHEVHVRLKPRPDTPDRTPCNAPAAGFGLRACRTSGSGTMTATIFDQALKSVSSQMEVPERGTQVVANGFVDRFWKTYWYWTQGSLRVS